MEKHLIFKFPTYILEIIFTKRRKNKGYTVRSSTKIVCYSNSNVLT